MDVERGLVGRSAELARIEALVGAAAAGGSGALVVSGPAGIGRTSLLRHAEEVAAALPQPLPVLRTAGVEPEADLPFAGLHRLLLPVLDRLEALPPAQAAGLRAALGLATDAVPDRFLVGAGVLSLLAEAAGTRGLLAVVDDAQWLDRESAQALAFAGRRLGAEGLALLVAVRDGGAPGFDADGLPGLRLGALAPPDAARLLDLAAHPLADAVHERLVELGEGNPLALTELAAALTPGQRTGTDPLPPEVPLNDRVRRAVLTRVDSLPDATRRLLLVAAADPAADLGLLATAAERLGLDVQALESAEQAGLVTTGPGGVTFASALLRAAVYADAPFLRRRAVHGALADAYGTARPDRWAWHRGVVAEGTDPVLADELERSADRARARAGYGATAAMLERSAELSADAHTRGRRLTAAAAAAWDAGQPERARRLLDESQRLDLPPVTAARAAAVRGLLESAVGRPAAAVPVLIGAARELAGEAPEEAVGLVTAAMEAAARAGDYSQAGTLSELAEQVSGGSHPLTGLLRGLARLTAGDPAGAAVPLQEFIEHVSTSDDHRRLSWGGAAASFLGQGPASLHFYDRAIAAARQSGALSALPWLLENRALIEGLMAKAPLAESDADESLRLTQELGLARPPVLAMVAMASAAALRGDAAAFREWSARIGAAAERHGMQLPVGLAQVVELRLHLSLGRLDDAMLVVHRVEAAGPRQHPMIPVLSFPDRVEARVRAGEPVDEDGVGRYEAWVHLGGERPYAVALARRCRALLAGPERADALFREAVRLGEGIDQPFEEARTRLLHGEFLRRHRRPADAREALRVAADSFDRLGAAAWAARARSELRAAGAAVADPVADTFAELTPQELQIVRLVGSGLSNRQVAGHLFLSPRTVEYHLYKVYPKLGISSRTDLIRVAAQHLVEPVDA